MLKRLVGFFIGVAIILGVTVAFALVGEQAASASPAQVSSTSSQTAKHTTASTGTTGTSSKAAAQHNTPDSDGTTVQSNTAPLAASQTDASFFDDTRLNTPQDVNNNSPPAGSIPGTVTVTGPVYTKSSSSAATTATVQASATTAGKVQGEFVSSTGFHPSHPASKYVHYIKAGTYYSNSYRGRDGLIHYFPDECGGSSKYTHPLTSGSHKGYCVFYYDTKLHVWRKPDCGNYVKFPSKPTHHIMTNLILYKTFASVSWKDTVKLNESGSVKAMASCQVVYNGQVVVSSSATGSASASLSIYVTVYVSAKYSVTAKSSGPGHVSSSQWASLAASVSAKGQLTIKANAQATCYYVPPPPPSCSNGNTFPYCNAPSLTLSATGCAGNGNSSVLNGTIVNSNTVSVTADLELKPATPGGQQVINVGANASKTFTFTVSAPGTYYVKAALEEGALPAVNSNTVVVEQCSTPTCPPGTHGTPPNCYGPPSVVSVFQPQNVKLNAHFTTCENSVMVPVGRTATVTVSAHIGTIDAASKVQHVTGSSDPITVCYGYTAPGEVGNDYVTIKVVDDQDSSFFDSQSTDPFPIQAPPA